MYTVWQGDQLVGETDLSYEPARPRHRAGNLFTSPGAKSRISSADLSLSLRDATGRIIPTEWVVLYDLDSSAVAGDAAESGDFAFDEPLVDEFSRYQIQLMLADGAPLH